MKTNRIIQGDCLDVMKTFKDGIIDLTVTSPPYDNLRTYNGYTFDFEGIAKQLFRITKTGGVVVWVVGDATIKGSETCTSFKQALYFKEIGFNLHDTMIYQKKNYMPLTHNRYEQSFEYMFILSKGKPNVFNPIKIKCDTVGTKRNRGGSKGSEKTYSERKRAEKTIVNKYKQSANVFMYKVGENDKTIHKAPFPEQLANDHIISWSNKNDLVFDPFMGSGTTAKMAIKNNRQYLGCEISKEYIDIANKRIKHTCGLEELLK